VVQAARTAHADVASMSNEELKDQLRFILGEPELDEGELMQYEGVRCAVPFKFCCMSSLPKKLFRRAHHLSVHQTGAACVRSHKSMLTLSCGCS
jgi:hypothetical protein